MTTLDQVRLLEEKVEGAVVKLQQLQAENDALRKRCDELTNALSSKSEQLSSFTTDQNEIEDGLKKALDRLNFIENSVLKAKAVKTENTTIAPNGQVASSIQITPGVTSVTHTQINQQQLNQINQVQNNTGAVPTTASFNSMNVIPEQPVEIEEEKTVDIEIPKQNIQFAPEDFDINDNFDDESNNAENADADNDQDDLGFDIF